MHSPKEELLKEPPKWPIKVMKLFLRSEFVEEIEGDMYEEYQFHLENFQRRKPTTYTIEKYSKYLGPA